MAEGEKKAVLDLDAFMTPRNSFKLGGKEWAIQEVPVKTFLRVVKLQEELDKAESTEDVITLFNEVIHDAVPDLPQEMIDRMSIKQMLALVGILVMDIRGASSKKATAPIPETPTATNPLT